MTTPNKKLQQTARKLGLSVKTLEQYMALKTAEVSPRQASPRPQPSR